MSYRDTGIEAYGHSCEICGYGIVEVHHVNYQLHTEWEKKLRLAARKGENLSELLSVAQKLGFLEWDGHDLSKDDRVSNLSVLCGNHHNLVHLFDAGLNLLKALPKRK